MYLYALSGIFHESHVLQQYGVGTDSRQLIDESACVVEFIVVNNGVDSNIYACVIAVCKAAQFGYVGYGIACCGTRAKAVGAGFYYEGDFFDFNLHKATPKKCLPIGVVLTISSAGSESSNSCVIQDDEKKIKQGFNCDLVRPVFAIENPELTYSVPGYQTFAGVSDIMMHSLERYHNASGENELADEWALSLILSTMEAAKTLLRNPNDYEARARVMLNSSLTHDGLTSLGKTSVFVVHPLEHALSGYDQKITHGAGVALLYPVWATYVYKKDIGKFAKLTEYLFKEKGATDEETAIMGIRLMKEFFSSLGMPTTFQEVGLGEKDIPALVSIATGNGTRTVGRYPQPLTEQDVEAIYRLLL